MKPSINLIRMQPVVALGLRGAACSALLHRTDDEDDDSGLIVGMILDKYFPFRS